MRRGVWFVTHWSSAFSVIAILETAIDLHTRERERGEGTAAQRRDNEGYDPTYHSLIGSGEWPHPLVQYLAVKHHTSSTTNNKQ